MGDSDRSRAGRRYRRRRRFRSRRAVVSVVGTLLALLVFFSLFGVFLSQYLPVWMGDNEVAFTAQVQAAMAELKSNADLQVALGGPSVLTTSLPMSSQGIPVLAAPTQAILNFVQNSPGVFLNVSMTVGPGGSGPFYQNYSMGAVQVSLPNRYYVPQTFEYEADAVIQSQSSSQQIVDYLPLISLNQSGQTVSATITAVQLFGNSTQTITQGTEQLYTHLLFRQPMVSTGPVGGGTFGATFVLGTHYPCAWGNFLNTTLAQSGVPSSHYTLSPGSLAACQSSSAQATVVKLVLTGLSELTLVLGGLSVSTGLGVT